MTKNDEDVKCSVKCVFKWINIFLGLGLMGLGYFIKNFLKNTYIK